MSDHQPMILDAQAMLSIDLSGTKLIEASAGTGKTYTIANLYLRYILEGRSPAEILVVTFTNAATEELRGRIRARLFQTLQFFNHPQQTTTDEFLSLLMVQWQSYDQQQQLLYSHRLQLALRCMDQASILTIHSFCQRAMQDHALQSNQFFQTNLITDDQLLWEQALKDWWREQSYALTAADWALYQMALGNVQTLIKQQKQIRNSYAVEWLPKIDKSLTDMYLIWRSLGADIKKLAQSWRTNREDLICILSDSIALSRSKTLPYHPHNLTGFIAQIDAWFGSEAVSQMPENAKYLTTDELHAQSKSTKKGKDDNLNHPFFMQMESFWRRLKQIKLDFRAAALLDAFEYATQKVHQQKLESHSLAYDDQLTRLLAALKDRRFEALTADLRQHFPVAMIDEFQDTDATQYQIFEHLYFSQSHLSLTMIGDPKQAIYSFRGGDIFTYMKARRAPDVLLCSLRTNWRSEAGLIKAVNCFFLNKDAPFIYDDTISFSAALAAPNSTTSAFSLNGLAQLPVTLWHIPLNDVGKTFSKADISQRINEVTANEIAKLISSGQSGDARLGEHNLRSSDIAILVRTSNEGRALSQVLTTRGIGSVIIGKDKIFDSEEATALCDLLEAIGRYTNRQSLRRGLACQLLQHSYAQIAEIIDDGHRWDQSVELFKDLHKLWINKGFISMFQQLLQRLDLSQRLATSDNAARRLTNLLHLAEILQQQSRVSAGIDHLITWFRKQILDTTVDEAQLRLETDAALVKIITIHKSKGLEYPIVFLPFIWNCRAGKYTADDIIRFHNDQFDAVINIGSEQRKKHACLAEKERLAEDIRLLYVALTRARSKVYMAWGDVGDAKSKGQPYQSALAYLLHSKQTPDDLNRQLPQGFDSPDIIASELKALAAKSGGTIEVLDLPEAEMSIVETAENTAKNTADIRLKASVYEPQKKMNWRIASFSSLTRNIHQVAHRGSSVRSNDNILNFPAGSHTGLLLHHLLEELNFCGDIAKQCADIIPRFASKFGLDSKAHQQTLTLWAEKIVVTRLNSNGLMLSKLENRQRLNELSFDFALDDLDIAELNQWLNTRKLSHNNLSNPHRLKPITARNFRGLINGVIDLVFEFEGKYYLADYKSNYLGSRLDDYQAHALTQAIFDRRYDLQYLIYTIALHRYLAKRIPDYKYETHFGGVYYLFIRAMRPENTTDYGIFFDLPDYQQIVDFDKLTTAP